MKDILLVEDQEELAGLMEAFLKKDGYSVAHVTTGEAAIEYIGREKVQMVLLDIMLPGMDGFAVCDAIRQKKDTPIIILSARNSKTDKLTGFNLGADDYIEKPVDLDILLAKVSALLSRSYGTQSRNEILVSGQISIDTEARKAYLNGGELELNVKEYELLLLFVQNPGKTLHKDYIFAKIWGADSESENQTLTVHVKRLRSRIEQNEKKPERIQTVWGVGYRYEEI